MGSTIENTSFEIHLEEEWKRERKEAFQALEKIANSENVNELQKNLNELKNIYISEIAIDDDSVGKLISELDFSMPRIKEYLDKSARSQKLYFLIGLIIALLGIFIGLVL
ncbi:MAG: hypothetical protein E3J36_02110 [Candidatus Nealsonbacteria bacterium]|nr:MAG: hypothetical protein E3J36_02110 [Candidatus Nealsonbacteria bacterium]